MSQSVVPQSGEDQQASDAKAVAEAQQDAPARLNDPHTPPGDTTTDDVVTKIAGIATREVSGVYAMGNAAQRVISGTTSRVAGNSGQQNVAAGVSVDTDEYQTAIAVSVVVEYGSSIVTISQQIRDNVIQAVEHGTNLQVVSVDVNVSDVHLPADDTDSTDSPSSSSEPN